VRPEVKILVTPSHIKAATSQAVKLLKSLDYEVLFLNFPKDWQDAVQELAEGAPYDRVKEMIQELTPDLTTSWEYAAEPLLKFLRGVVLRQPKLRVYCYKDPEVNRIRTRFSEETTMLIFRYFSTGRMKGLGEWERLLNSYLESNSKALEEEVTFVIEKIKRESGICIAGFDGKYIKKGLQEAGYDVELQYLHVPYHFTPVEVLMREAPRSTIFSERMVELLQHHAHFIGDYVLTAENYDQAHRKWMWNTAPWLRRMITRTRHPSH